MTSAQSSVILPIVWMEPIRKDDKAIAQVNVDFFRAFEEGNPEKIAMLWASTVPISCVHPGWQPVVGREAVLASFVSILAKTAGVRFSLRNMQIFLWCECAWVLLLEEWSPLLRDGESPPIILQTTHILVEEERRWKLTHRHASPAVGAALPPSDPRRLFH